MKMSQAVVSTLLVVTTVTTSIAMAGFSRERGLTSTPAPVVTDEQIYNIQKLQELNIVLISITETAKKQGSTKELEEAYRGTAALMLKVANRLPKAILDQMGVDIQKLIKRSSKEGPLVLGPQILEEPIVTADSSGAKSALHSGADSKGAN